MHSFINKHYKLFHTKLAEQSCHSRCFCSSFQLQPLWSKKRRKKGHNISSIHFPRGTTSPRIPPPKKKTSQKSQVSLGAYAKKAQHQHADCQHHTRTLVSIFVETHFTMGLEVRIPNTWKLRLFGDLFLGPTTFFWLKKMGEKLKTSKTNPGSRNRHFLYCWFISTTNACGK